MYVWARRAEKNGRDSCVKETSMATTLCTYSHILSYYYFLFVLDIDDCVNRICHNGGSCVDGINSYSCNCVTGYNGDHCETGKTLTFFIST